MESILMTGGTGFLGSSLLKKLADRYQMIVLKRSFSSLERLPNALDHLHGAGIRFYDIDKVSLQEIFQKEKVDIVLHCATNYGRGYQKPMDVITANLIMPLELLELSRQGGVSTFINTDTILDKGVNYYSLSKSNFKEWLRTYSSDMACVNIANSHFYGPTDDKTKFLSFVIHEILRGADKIDLTPGKQKRDFIYIDDVVEGFLAIFRNLKSLGKGYHHFEIGTGIQAEIKDVVLLVKALAGNDRTQLNFGALPYRVNEAMESHVDVSLLKSFGWQHRYSLKEGLWQTIQQERALNKG